MSSLLRDNSVESRRLLRLPEGADQEQRPHELPWGNEVFPGAAITDHDKQGGLKQQKCTLSHFRRPEVQNHGVGKVGSFWRL